jgi:hypothetical protein
MGLTKNFCDHEWGPERKTYGKYVRGEGTWCHRYCNLCLEIDWVEFISVEHEA